LGGLTTRRRKDKVKEKGCHPLPALWKEEKGEGNVRPSGPDKEREILERKKGGNVDFVRGKEAFLRSKGNQECERGGGEKKKEERAG